MFLAISTPNSKSTPAHHLHNHGECGLLPTRAKATLLRHLLPCQWEVPGRRSKAPAEGCGPHLFQVLDQSSYCLEAWPALRQWLLTVTQVVGENWGVAGGNGHDSSYFCQQQWLERQVIKQTQMQWCYEEKGLERRADLRSLETTSYQALTSGI